MFREVEKSFRKLSLLLLMVAVAFLLWGCGGGGGSSYDTPAETNNEAVGGSATNVVIEPETLKTWMDDGLVGNETGFGEKVVIVDFRSPAESDRIKGACRLEAADLTATRFEGVGDAAPLVATGAQMDAAIQRLGIDENTTIVFTTGGSAYLATRAYWTFRYWGFPKERLKFLNGGNAAFAAEYSTSMTAYDDAPTPTASTYSVRNLDSINDDLRASIGELIEIIKTDLTTSTADIVFDARGDSYYNGTKATSGLVGGDIVVVDGHPEGGQYLSQAELFTDGKFKTAAEIETLFTDKGWDAGKKVTVYCTSGYSATPLFFAIDAILDADVQLHDGSWSQTGKYSSNSAAGGELGATSPWAIDRYLDAATYTYNQGLYPGPLKIETLDAASAVAPQPAPFTADVPADDSDVVQSQVEAADGDYADGTGTVSFVAPSATTDTPTVLISQAELQAMIDAGLVNNDADPATESVVILDVTSSADYVAKRHIPGAQLWNYVGQAIVRTEGPAPAVNLVLDGASMDARIQAAGIDENTTIVITSSATATYFPSRAYFLFRYWGFPKERIKVLNGYNGAWPQAELTVEAPTITPSTLSVADLDTGAQLDTRVSLAELMDAVRDGRGIAVDMRGDKSATKSTAGVFSLPVDAPVTDDYVVFEGTPKGGTSFSWKNFNVDYDGGDFTFEDAATIEAGLNAAGVDGSEVAYSYCRTGYIASTGFFVLDAILDWPVMTYDGSWSQWGKMSTVTTDMGGELPDGSTWATDSATYMDVINYNEDHIKVVEPLNADADALLLAPADANQVEDADYEYQTTPPADSGSSSDDAPTAGSGDLGGNC
ncbi:selenite/tellurite reduction operon rhodanese-like protein ExtH [uncultured Desulfuromusa sp.]|uniref:selenite/tellurite reduction operon rhodanese-like protein ExtH n=1 Tax=uncultured Desulfuromusa sp. TaxID=219183 RepID=UPI002AA6413B|nr:selenite/tellurite reduction operon rhodanese-like protein ExtH [uncultured Desulfuromusa sp.]